MHHTKLFLAGFAIAALAATALTPSAEAQYYKGKTINFLVPVPGGSGLDLQARIMAKHLAGAYPRQTEDRGPQHAGRRRRQVLEFSL